MSFLKNSYVKFTLDISSIRIYNQFPIKRDTRNELIHKINLQICDCNIIKLFLEMKEIKSENNKKPILVLKEKGSLK